jgi:trehalose synthase-fused probable maltokinase
MAPRPAIDRRLQRLASAFTPEWLAGQRWYRAKSRGVATVQLTDAAEVEGSPGWLLVLEAADAEGGLARYQLPAVADGDQFREPLDGEGVWRTLASLMLEGGELTGARGAWRFAPTDAAAALASLEERRLGVEQSNTSVALGEALMLKVYRLIEPGLNPEMEMNAFLTRAGFREAPALAGSATYVLDGASHSAAMLQQLVPATGDGWNWVLDRLAAAPDGAAELIRGIGLIGSLTARMHAALVSEPDAPGFPSRPATRAELAAWAVGARRQLDAALDVLDATARPRLAAVAPQIRARFDALEDGGDARVSRIHGDYHLGQLLRTANGFAVIDFEGEPARTLEERRAPGSPLRDVAGMLRSLDYAAHAADWGAAPADREEWLGRARGTFLDAYGGVGPDGAPLLAAFELEKACYEVVYEANNRPDWTWLPLEALERQVTSA